MNRRQRRRRQRMRRAALLAPPLAGACLWLVGLLVSPVHREVATRGYSASPQALWSALVDLDGMPQWRRDLVALERLPHADGRERWLEVGRGGSRVLERRGAVSEALLVVGEVEGSRRWVYRLTRTETGTTLRLTEERAIRNPALRTLVKIFGSDRGRIEGLADDLALRLVGHRQVAVAVGR